LGHLSYLHIWHDHSGKGNWGSWFLDEVIINDLQTKQKYHFICNKWLGVDRDDGLIERVIPVSGKKQEREFFYILKKEIGKSIKDGYLWLSIFTKPPYSSFSRVERITCCFVLLFISMLLNIFYYGIESKTTDEGVDLGLIYFAPKQVNKIF
jgi:polycystin 1L2